MTFEQWIDDRQALALEISAELGITLALAVEIAADELVGLADYAAEWDTWAAAWQDRRPVITGAVVG